MKNSYKNSIMLFVMLVTATFIAGAQSISTTEKVSTDKQDATQQAPAEKFFNIQSLDDLKVTIDAAYTNYKMAAHDQADALHLDYLKAKRLYTVELEKQRASYSKDSETGQKIRIELGRISSAE
ncbi:MAG: hypothetical protein JJE25_03630 [Bacteroidia bacterium]|nr:hypothetical protein [Bacteroidia bacterium]